MFYDILQSETTEAIRYYPQKIELITSPVFHYGGIIISLYTKYIPISYTYCNSYSVLIERASIDINLVSSFVYKVER